MRIEYLADHQNLLPELAQAHFVQWGQLRPGETIEARTRRLEGCCGGGGVPTVFVALVGANLCGSALLIAHDMETLPELTPWLAGVWVAPEYRCRGYGSALVDRVVAEARGLGVPELYLYTPDAVAFYVALGWSVIARVEYRGQAVAVMSLDVAERPEASEACFRS